jgi:molybdenum cofactor cytidylyltransferase
MRPVLLLAAGASSGVPEGKLQKQYQGKSLLRWSLESLTQHRRVSVVHLVCGGHAQSVLEIAQDFPDIVFVMNPDWTTGLASSLQAGLRSLPEGALGVGVCLADTPFASERTIADVLTSDPDKICFPVYRGAPGHPKYFPRWTFVHLLKLSGDEGARSVLNRFPQRTLPIAVEDSGVVKDFDRPEDF